MKYLMVISLFLLSSLSLASDAQDIHILVGGIEGSTPSDFSDIWDFAFWFKNRGYRIRANFAASEDDLVFILRSSETAGVIWIGHSLVPGGIEDSTGKKIRWDAFSIVNPSVKFLSFISCCTLPSVVEYYGIKINHPDLPLFYYPAPESQGVNYFRKHLSGLFLAGGSRKGLFEALKSRERCVDVISDGEIAVQTAR